MQMFREDGATDSSPHSASRGHAVMRAGAEPESILGPVPSNHRNLGLDTGGHAGSIGGKWVSTSLK
jgi:hypothetical protein